MVLPVTTGSDEESKDVEKLELSSFLVGTTLQNSLAASNKVDHALTSNHTPRDSPNKNEVHVS